MTGPAPWCSVWHLHSAPHTNMCNPHATQVLVCMTAELHATIHQNLQQAGVHMCTPQRALCHTVLSATQECSALHMLLCFSQPVSSGTSV
jgi:hypothetical protein